MLGSAALALTPAAAQSRVEVDLAAFGSSNAFLLPGDEEATFGGDVTVRSSTTTSIDDHTTLEAEGRLGFRQYSRRFGNFLTGRGAGTLQHRRNEYLSLRSDLYYERILPAEALAESVDAAIDPVTIRENFGAAQALFLHPDSRTEVEGQVSWARTRPTGSSPLTETTAVDFLLGVERRVTEHLTLGAHGQYTLSDTRVGLDPAVASFRLTASRRLRDDWRAEAELGIEQESTDTLTGGRDGGPVRFSGRALLCLEPERSSLCFSAGIRSVVSGLGLQRETSFGAVFSRQMVERGTLTLNADYRRAPITGSDADADVLAIGSRYEHQVSRRFHLFGGVDYLRRGLPFAGEVGALAGRVGISFRETGR